MTGLDASASSADVGARAGADRPAAPARTPLMRPARRRPGGALSAAGGVLGLLGFLGWAGFAGVPAAQGATSATSCSAPQTQQVLTAEPPVSTSLVLCARPRRHPARLSVTATVMLTATRPVAPSSFSRFEVVLQVAPQVGTAYEHRCNVLSAVNQGGWKHRTATCRTEVTVSAGQFTPTASLLYSSAPASPPAASRASIGPAAPPVAPPAAPTAQAGAQLPATPVRSTSGWLTVWVLLAAGTGVAVTAAHRYRDQHRWVAVAHF